MNANNTSISVDEKYKIVINESFVITAKIENIINSINALKEYIDSSIESNFDLTDIENKYTSLENTYKDLQDAISILDNGISELKKTYEDYTSSMSITIDSLKSSIDENQSTITSIKETYVDKDSASAISIDAVNSKYNSFVSYATELHKTYSTELSSVSEEIEDIKSTIDDPDSGLNVTSEYLSSIYTEVGFSEEYDEDGNLIKTGTGIVKTVEDLTVRTNDAESNIENLQEVTSTHTEQISTLTTTVNNNTTTISEVKSITDNIATASVLITDDNGYITGYKAVGSTDESSFDIYASKFSVTDGSTNFTPFLIDGSNIYFNGKVNFSNIDTGTNGEILTTATTISGDQIRTGVIYGGGDGTPDDYKMMINLTDGYIYIK